MTDPTPEQIAAAQKRVAEWTDVSRAPSDVRLLAALLDSLDPALTNPHPVLPTEEGRYQDVTGDTRWYLNLDGRWLYDGALMPAGYLPHAVAPFTRLVPERPPITREQVQTILERWFDHAKTSLLADDLTALANGTAR